MTKHDRDKIVKLGSRDGATSMVKNKVEMSKICKGRLTASLRGHRKSHSPTDRPALKDWGARTKEPE